MISIPREIINPFNKYFWAAGQIPDKIIKRHMVPVIHCIIGILIDHLYVLGIVLDPELIET